MTRSAQHYPRSPLSSALSPIGIKRCEADPGTQCVPEHHYFNLLWPGSWTSKVFSQERTAAKAKVVDAYNEARRAKPLVEQHADEVKKVNRKLPEAWRIVSRT